MDPICFKIGSFPIHWYGVMMALGLFAGLFSWTIVGKKEGRSFNFCSDLAFWIMISGILGARVAYLLANWSYYSRNLHLIHRLDKGGLIYYGGLVAAIVAVIIFARKRKEKTLRLFDFVGTSLPLAHAFGRIGCFFNGCCHGTPLKGFPSVQFPRNSFPWDRHVDLGLIPQSAMKSMSVHPTQLYETMLDLMVYAILVFIYKKQKKDGTTTAFYLLIYPVGRFILEYFRGDERLMVGPLSFAQVMSLVLFAAGVVLLGIATMRSRRTADSAS